MIVFGRRDCAAEGKSLDVTPESEPYWRSEGGCDPPRRGEERLKMTSAGVPRPTWNGCSHGEKSTRLDAVK